MSFKANQSVVSIIIPCYNAKQWVQEAIDSCLNQTYPNIEIVVVDDGSTDGSLEVLRHFLPRIKLETATHLGGNSARNRGFALSTGEYIQYLDADDYLDPDKIARQVQFLEETQADVVYGDWRYRRHLPDTSLSYLDKIQVSGVQEDILYSLLSGQWWVAPGALLYRRQVVIQAGGWDETLRAAQDRDFFTSVALSDVKIRYQAGCYFIYRKHGDVTVSSSNLGRWVENHCISLKKSEIALARIGRLTEKYRAALATGYFGLARGTCYTIDAQYSYANYEKMLVGLLNKTLDLCPQFNVADETPVFKALQQLFGFKFATRLLFPIRLVIHYLKSKLKSTFLLVLLLRIRRVNLQHGAIGHL